jgi:hypothetical protein
MSASYSAARQAGCELAHEVLEPSQHSPGPVELPPRDITAVQAIETALLVGKNINPTIKLSLNLSQKLKNVGVSHLSLGGHGNDPLLAGRLIFIFLEMEGVINSKRGSWYF